MIHSILGTLSLSGDLIKLAISLKRVQDSSDVIG